uniref:Uncharacterized protein n=1 Tax=Kalanchoe fedtschenkoi TaxID=63787 RepID=A0A7N0ULP3_KALFE
MTRRGFVGLVSSASSYVVFKEVGAASGRQVDVGLFLPPLPSDPSFVQFTASPKDTPALQAGDPRGIKC